MDLARGSILRTTQMERCFGIRHIIAAEGTDVSVLGALPPQSLTFASEPAVEAYLTIRVARVGAIVVHHFELLDRKHAAAAEHMDAERKAAQVRFVVTEHIVENRVELGVTNDRDA